MQVDAPHVRTQCYAEPCIVRGPIERRIQVEESARNKQNN